jgi:enoyl-CoA hydratase/carnithine racemase
MSDIHVRQRNDMLWLILDRQPRNDLTVSMLNQLAAALVKAIEKRPRLIVITGMGDEAFCSGVTPSDGIDAPHQALLLAASEVSDTLRRVREAGITMVALIKGIACGAGCELVALCDVVCARDDATFRLPTASTAIFPTVLSESLPAAIGQDVTRRYSQSGETLSAPEAMQLGLVHQVIAGSRFVQDVEELLTMLAATTSMVP